MKWISSLLLFICFVKGVSAQSGEVPRRIISLGTVITETTDALGMGSRIVATDVTSEYPAYIKKLPKVSRNRAVSVEGLMRFNPDLVLAHEGEISKAVAYQLQKAGVRLVVLQHEYSVRGAEKLIRELAAALGVQQKGEELVLNMQQELKAALQKVKSYKGRTQKVLFVYARGAGNMTIAGKGTNMDAIIELAGAKNAVQEFAAFKPYSTEALIKANPDVIVMFDFGISSLGGKNAILKMPGVMLTNAGKNQRIVEVDGPLMVNFSSRLGEAITDLHSKIYN